MLLLALGAAVGIALAAIGLGAGNGRGGVPDGAVATVNGVPIWQDELERVIAGVEADRRQVLTEEERRRILDRLIEEELLVQRGLDLGLARSDRKVRADLTGAVIQSVVAEVDDVEPSDSDLQAFYDEHRDFFGRVSRLRVQQVFCRVTAPSTAPAALRRAEEAVRRLRAGEPFGAVREALADAELAPVPDAPLPPAKLRDYVGLTAVRAVEALPVGGVTDPVRSGTGYHVLQVLERQAEQTPPLAEVKAQVAAEYRRRAGDRALRAYLDELRAAAEVAAR